MEKMPKQIYDEAGIWVKQYFDGQEERLWIDISGYFDKNALKEIKKKVAGLKIEKKSD